MCLIPSKVKNEYLTTAMLMNVVEKLAHTGVSLIWSSENVGHYAQLGSSFTNVYEETRTNPRKSWNLS